MNPTDKLLGNIAAINTFIDNFPMSILDMMHGKAYTSIFDFMIDVLAACGVDINEIINKLLEEIYGIEAKVVGGVEGLYDQIRSGTIEIDNQNEFMESLENSIKMIFMGLLSSIFTCSALPILPNRIFDGPNNNIFKKDVKPGILNALSDPMTPFEPVIIPKSIIDPMGILDITPTSEEGRLFYAIEGNDKYYKKSYVQKPIIVPEIVVSDSDGIIERNIKKTVFLYDTIIEVYPKIIIKGGYGNEWGSNKNDFLEDTFKFYINVLKRNEKTGKLEKDLNGTPIDLLIKLSYNPYNSKDTQTWETLIKKGNTESETFKLLSPKNEEGEKAILSWVSVNGFDGEGSLGNKIWFYLSKELAKDYVDEWSNNGVHSLPWGNINNDTEDILIKETLTVNVGETYENNFEKTEYEHTYVVLSNEDVSSIGYEKFERVNYLPTSGVDASSPEYIVCYEGLNPNLLYRTFDMNAFIWYVLHKGMKIPQIEYNHMMWDSRVSASKNGIGRKNASEWNQWYNSKTGYTEEFKYFGESITKETPLFPIIQLESQGMSENLLRVRIPSQRYFIPKIREYNIKYPNGNDNEKKPNHAFNTSMYRFNWEYLNNIQILRPKILVVGLLEYLLGFSLSTIKSADMNFTKKIIEAKLSNAIKSVIEANDMEVEDCYMTFSNDEVNTMLEEMLLSRYNATIYGGETTTVRVHDTEKYISMIDQVNASAKQEGNITMLTKLITEVTTNPGAEGSINYGISLDTDGNLLKKLLWAIVMPILLSIFTPQLLLLIYFNFNLMGITKIDDFLNQDFTKIINLLMNKIFGLLKSIIIFVKDKIVVILLRFLYEKILPLIMKYEMILLLEKIQYWLDILKAAIACLPRFKFKFNKVIGSIDNVEYADIIPPQNTPESTSSC